MTWNGDIIREQATLAEWAIAEAETEVSTLQTRLAAAAEEVSRLAAQVKSLTPPPLKPALKGLITTKPENLDTIPYAEFGSFKVPWNTVETAPYTYDFSGIDRTLAEHPDIKFRVRFMAGTHAPEWVKTRSGGAIEHFPDTNTGAPGSVPRFWTPNYYDDYMGLMSAVAKRYESNPQVVEIPNSLTTTIYAEPFILNADSATITRYWDAGYRFDLVRANLLRSIDKMMWLFPTTRISLAGHGKWERIINGTINRDWPEERKVFNDLRAAYGPRLVLDDHGLWTDDAIGVPQPSLTATTWYNYMAGLKDTETTYGWQFTPKDDNMLGAAQMGIEMGARFLEFAGFERIPVTDRRIVHDALLANAEEVA